MPENIGELFNDQTYEKAILKVPVGTIDLYRNTWPWMQFVNIEEDSSLEIVGAQQIQLDKSNAIFYINGTLRHTIVGDVVISIFDMAGKLVLDVKSGADIIDVSGLLPGVYVVKAMYDNDVITHKFVVK